VWQAKLQRDVTTWVAVQVGSTTDSNVIQDTLKFVELVKRTTRQLTPTTEHRVLDFLTQLGVNTYAIASRKIDAEAREVFKTLLLHATRSAVTETITLERH